MENDPFLVFFNAGLGFVLGYLGHIDFFWIIYFCIHIMLLLCQCKNVCTLVIRVITLINRCIYATTLSNQKGGKKTEKPQKDRSQRVMQLIAIIATILPKCKIVST